MKALISVIIPVYNVRKYLDKCVKSVISQSFNQLDIILVDDGSTDGSGELCDRWAEREPRIRVVHKENGGLSSARNAGMQMADGDYISFIDSDDFIHFNHFKLMYETQVKTNADIVCVGVLQIDATKARFVRIPTRNPLPQGYELVEKENIFEQLKKRDLETVVQWNKLYKRDVLFGIKYPLGKYHEDVYVIHEELYKSDRIAYLDAKTYYYVQRSGSIMKTESMRTIDDAIEGYVSRIAFFDAKNLRKEKDEAVEMLLKYVSWKIECELSTNGRSDALKHLYDAFFRIYSGYDGKRFAVPEYDQLIENKDVFIESIIDRNKELKSGKMQRFIRRVANRIRKGFFNND